MEEDELLRFCYFWEICQHESCFVCICVIWFCPCRCICWRGLNTPDSSSSIGEKIPISSPLKLNIISLIHISVKVHDKCIHSCCISVLMWNSNSSFKCFLFNQNCVWNLDYLSHNFIVWLKNVNLYSWYCCLVIWIHQSWQKNIYSSC